MNPSKTSLIPAPREIFKIRALFQTNPAKTHLSNPTIAFDYSPAIA